MRRALAALCCAFFVLCTGAVAPADAEADTRKARKVCVIKKQGRKPVRRLCLGPVRRIPAARRPAPSAVPAASPFGAPAPAALLPDVGGAAGDPASPSAGDAGPAAATCVPTASPWLGATAADSGGFRLFLSRTCLPAGQVLVQLRNIDEQPHNLYVEGVAPAAPARVVIGDIDPQVTAQGAVDLAPGRWRFFCAIDGHASMAATVTAG